MDPIDVMNWQLQLGRVTTTDAREFARNWTGPGKIIVRTYTIKRYGVNLTNTEVRKQ
jgi:hypothetical protein